MTWADPLPHYECMGCGYCCKKTPCILGVKLYGREAPCGGLIHKEGRYWCRAILEASPDQRKLLVQELAIGAGCCSPLNTDRRFPSSSSSNSHGP